MERNETVVLGNKLPPELVRPFKIIAFDWDGTAVMSRQEDAGPVRELLERLLRAGVFIVVITGTNFPNIDRQLSAAIRGPHKRNLNIATNRGSEVYGFDVESRPVALWRRTATAEENRLLTEVADTVRDALVARTGLDIRAIYNRLNRRKIDLIPLPEWRDPPKSQIGQLLRAVQARLKAAGLAGGLGEAFELAQRVAREKGLKDARITSDVKHIEVGLTDKSEAIDWIIRELAQKMRIRPEDILIAGDEFGPIAGFEGSDYKMVTPQARGAVYISVGPEPNGAPPEVIHLGGGPPRFTAVIAGQIALHQQDVQRKEASASGNDPLDLPAALTTDPNWLLIEEGFTLAREHEIESLFAIANGYVGTRGSLAEGSSLSSPATFVAGVFDVNPRSGSLPELAAAPDWMRLRVTVDGHQLKLEDGGYLEHRRVLDLRQGMLWREWRHRDPAGRVTRLRFLRLASLADRHVLLQSVTLTPENYSGRVRLESLVEQPSPAEGQYVIAVPGFIPTPPALLPKGSSSPLPNIGVLTLRAQARDITVALAAASRFQAEADRRIKRYTEYGKDRFVERWDWEAEIGKTYRLDRIVTVHTSRDAAQPPEAAARPRYIAATERIGARHLERLLSEGVESIVAAHTRTWETRWQAADVEVNGDEAAQRALRFAAYHLISAPHPEDERVSIGARGLTGGVYKGHVFWDTEIYMLPFYVFTYPPAARALLMYRHHTLPAAREKARAQGYRGALYPWESADTGEETTPSLVLAPDGEVIHILSGEQEHHISADIAYAVWRYWEDSGDDDFFTDAGAEIVLETARFWASRGRIEKDGRYHIQHVIGPDEYHEGVDDNAYTNVMAQWNLERGAEAVRTLKKRWPERWQELSERLGITVEEPKRWLRLAAAMYTGFDQSTGLFEQFRGYFDLEEIDLAAYEARTVPIDALLERERVQRSKVIKQPDVVLLIYLLWDRFSPQVREANFRYYEPRTGHGSSLSPAIHALVAARLGDLPLAERYFKQAAEIDLANNMGNAAGGIHMGALGGLWQSAVFGFGGMHLRSDGFAFDPHLPERWRSLAFRTQWQDRKLKVTVARHPPTIEVHNAGEGAIVTALLGGEETTIPPGHSVVARRHNAGWGRWQEASA